jgi:hypothetical protein
MSDTELLPKIVSEHDLIASEAKYHLKCLAKYTRKYEKHVREQTNISESECNMSRNHSVSFSYIINFIEESRSNGTYSFQLKDLTATYESRMLELENSSISVHRTRLKERILRAIPELQAFSGKKEIILAFPTGVSDVLKKNMQEQWDDEEVQLARSATLLRKKIISLNLSDQHSNIHYLNELFSFISHLLYGISNKDCDILPPVNTICSLLAYHLKIKIETAQW